MKSINYLNKLLRYILAISMLIMVSVTFYQIIMRYVFNRAPSWSEEFVRYLFVWISVLGAGMGIQEKVHIGVDAVVNLFPIKIRNIISIFVFFLIIAFGVFIIYYTIPIVKVTSTQISPALHIKVSYMYFSMVAFGVLCIIYATIESLKIIKQLSRKQEASK